MKIGDKFGITNYDLLEPLEGKLVEITLGGGETVTARVIAVGEEVSYVQVVPSLNQGVTMQDLAQIDGRFVHGQTNYPGDVTRDFDLNKPYGPNDNGELMWALAVEYDPEKDKSTVYFSLNPAAEVV